MSDSKSPSAQERDDLRLLIVCDTQFRWNGDTTLKLEEIERLVAREWLAEGEDNFEYEVTDAGRAAIDSALAPAPQVPEGMVLVPREPTREMMTAAFTVKLGKPDWMRLRYQAMLSAAPPMNELLGQPEEFNLNEVSGNSGRLASLEQRGIVSWLQWLVETVVADGAYADIGQKDVDRVRAFRREFESALVAQPPPEVVAVAELPIGSIDPRHLVLMKGRNGTFSGNIIRVGDAMQPGDTLLYTTPRPGVDVGKPEEFQTGVERWMAGCFVPSLYSNMTERGDRLVEEVLELLQAHGYDPSRIPTLVDYVYGRPPGEPGQEVGGVMVTLAGYCWIAGLNMHAEADRELARITRPEVMAKIRAKQEAKNSLHFDTPLPGDAAAPGVGNGRS